MALSEVVINDIVQSQTKAVISESNYHLLRQYLLERKPLLRILNSISSLLFEHCNSDKQAMINYLTQRACESQINHDSQEAINDEREQENEHALKINYERELYDLQNTLQQLETKCAQQEHYYNQINRQYNEFKISISRVNSNLERLRNERQIRYPEGNIHAHIPMTVPLQDQQTWDRLLQEENRLVEERQRLTYLFNSKESERTKEEQNLTQYLQEKKESERRYQEIKHQMEIVFPENEQQRHLRNEERLARSRARNTYDPHLQQLSPESIEALKQQIESQARELDNQRSQLMSEATEMSYKTYLTQLELALQHSENSPQIMFNEQTALKMIVGMMKNLTEMAEKEKGLINSLDEEQNKLRSLQKSLLECTRQLQNHLTSKPHLVKQNKELTEENERLQLKGEAAASYKKSALYVSLFSMSGSLVSTGIVSALIISPVFFTIPGALAMLSLVALVVALGFQYQKHVSETQREQNSQVMEKNDVILMKDWKKANELSLTTMAELNTKIEKSEKYLVELDQKLKEQQHVMSLVLNKAQSVSTSYSVNSTFFGNTTTGNVVYLPSAPSQDELLYPPIEEGTVHYGY
ncbi:type IV secretion protein Dot [Legionella sainthelensi]|uniref:type IV secretion protein Dot n=1 Tax=Legionella sainthelensi TaxID=28087 RepID=UPI000E20045A|nr:type IV secretion protein Dot [Legionella sainthelensi]